MHLKTLNLSLGIIRSLVVPHRIAALVLFGLGQNCQLLWELSSVFSAMWTENKSPNVSQMGPILFQQQINVFFFVFVFLNVLFCFHNGHSLETSSLWHMEFLQILGTGTCVSIKETSLSNSSSGAIPQSTHWLVLWWSECLWRMEILTVSLFTSWRPFSPFLKQINGFSIFF